MMRSLWTAASGMVGQQYNIDTISNNLSNVNTTGYKKVRAEFEDLIYQTERIAGTPATEITNVPLPTQVGHGTKVSATQRMFDQGSLQETGNFSDVAIEDEGFFRILMADGSLGYTRDGSFKVDSERRLVTSNGNYALPEVTFPEEFQSQTVAISKEGQITCKVAGSNEPVVVGQMQLYRFVNPAGLNAVGENTFKQTAASGDSITGQPNSNGMGQVIHKFLEMSNVSVASEMVNMIVAQRAYELNSKAIQTSDTMLGIANGLKR